MLVLTLVAVGEKGPDWAEQGFDHYARRIRGRMRLDLVRIAPGKRGRNADIPRIMRDEEQRITDAIPRGDRIIALDREGRRLSTLDMAQRMDGWLGDGERVSFVAGGPEGLSPEFLAGVDERWSLSDLTFAHPLVRPLFAEQVYRCHTILDGKPYHR